MRTTLIRLALIAVTLALIVLPSSQLQATECVFVTEAYAVALQSVTAVSPPDATAHDELVPSEICMIRRLGKLPPDCHGISLVDCARPWLGSLGMAKAH
jgi:hypothetical protein